MMDECEMTSGRSLLANDFVRNVRLLDGGGTEAGLRTLRQDLADD